MALFDIAVDASGALRQFAALETQLEAQLRVLASETAVAIAATAEAATAFHDRSGQTRAGIYAKDDPSGKFSIVGVDMRTHEIALHTSTRTGRIHTQRVTQRNVPIFLEFGTDTMTARPFLRPAADLHQARFRREVEDVLGQAIDHAERVP